MPTYTVTDGQSQSFTFNPQPSYSPATPSAAVDINAAGTSSVQIAAVQAHKFDGNSLTVNLNLAPNAQVTTRYNATVSETLNVTGDATTTLINNEGFSLIFGDASAPRVVIQPDVAGTGSFYLQQRSYLEFGRSVASGITVKLDNPGFSYASSTLKLDNPAAFKGAVDFTDGQVILAGLGGATDYDLANGVLTIYGGPGDAALAALRFTDNSPQKAGLALRLVGSDVQVIEQGDPYATTPAFLAGAALTQHMAPPPPAITTQPVTPPPPPTTQPSVNPPVLISDGTTGQPVTTIAAQPYAGPVAGIAQQVVAVSPQSLNILATAPNLFIRTGSGTDAIQALSGTNVLDGGTGSNFLTAGAGADTFFVDARGAAADTWSTVAKFGAGDAATLWGVSAATPQQWADGQGAAGATGLTLHAGAAGGPTASITLAGFTAADLAGGKVSASFGRDAASGSDYLYLRAA